MHSFTNLYLPHKCEKVCIMENQQVHREIFNVTEVKHERTADTCYLKIKRNAHMIPQPGIQFPYNRFLKSADP